MKNYCLNIQIKDSTPLIWRSIKTSDTLTFRQLHEAILTLFGWKDSEPYRFQMQSLRIHSSKEQEVRQHIHEYLMHQPTFTYIYGSPKEEWTIQIQATPMFGFDPFKKEIRLIAHEQNHPPYGIGGIEQYQKMLEEVKNPDSIHFHAIHMILEHTRPPFDERAIQQGLNIILSDTRCNQLDEVKEALQRVRMQLSAITSQMPCLLLIEERQHVYPCYMEYLENGIEIMIFYDENGFCRSILNSVNGEPDLLFTSSITIDFLDEEVEESDLLLSDHKNLCFCNRPGCLPSYPEPAVLHLIERILQRLQILLASTTALPCLEDQKMGILKQQLPLQIVPFIMKEEICSLQFPKDVLQELKTLPHTNEYMRIQALALPAKGCHEHKQMEVHIVASGNEYTKEESIQLTSMEILIDQLYYFFLGLFHERGLPECLYTNNINLANIMKEMGAALSIIIKAAKPSENYNESLMDILLSSFQLSEQDLYAIDAFEQSISEEQYPIEEEHSHMPKPKILN